MIDLEPHQLDAEQYFASAHLRLAMGELVIGECYRMVAAGLRIQDSHSFFVRVHNILSHVIPLKFQSTDNSLNGIPFYGRMTDDFWQPNMRHGLAPFTNSPRIVVRSGYFLPLESVADEADQLLRKQK